jgi:hypothetical protein
MNEVIIENDFYFFKCPYCEQEIIVDKKDLNCCIFRHAIYKHNYQQVDPHLTEYECKKLIEKNSVYGCCKPFEIINRNSKLYCVKCAYK